MIYTDGHPLSLHVALPIYRRMRLYGLAAIGLAIGLLAILIGSLVLSGYTAFVQTKVPLQVYVDPAQVEADDIGGGNYRKLARDAFLDLLPAELSRPQQRSYLAMLSPEIGRASCREKVCKNG